MKIGFKSLTIVFFCFIMLVSTFSVSGLICRTGPINVTQIVNLSSVNAGSNITIVNNVIGVNVPTLQDYFDTVYFLLNASTGNSSSEIFNVVNNGTFVRKSGDLMTGNLNMSDNNITDILLTVYDISGCMSTTPGTFCYDVDTDTMRFTASSGHITEMNQENNMPSKNTEGSIVNKSSVVYTIGATGGNPNVKLAKADNLNTSGLLGIMEADCNNNEVCPVSYFGITRNLDTSMYSEGDHLYLSATEAGNFTLIPPKFEDGGVPIWVATVIRVHANQGTIFVFPRLDSANGIVMNDLGLVGIFRQTDYSIQSLPGNTAIGQNIFTIQMNGTSGIEIPHLILQPGGAGQASVWVRSGITVPESTLCLNTINRTEPNCYANEAGFSWNIDFNTTLTNGADWGVTGELEVIKNVQFQQNITANGFKWNNEQKTLSITQNESGSSQGFKLNSAGGETFEIYMAGGNHPRLSSTSGTIVINDLMKYPSDIDMTFGANSEYRFQRDTGTTPDRFVLYHASEGVIIEVQDGLGTMSFDKDVGIKTANPQNTLDVEGAVAIGSSYSGTSTAPTNGLLIEGNVGIGTTAPISDLHVRVADSGNSGVVTGVAGLTLENNGNVNLNLVTPNTGTGNIVWVDDGVSPGKISFSHATGIMTLRADGADTMHLTDGNVGIGTASPSSKLHVAGNINISANNITNVDYILFDGGGWLHYNGSCITSSNGGCI